MDPPCSCWHMATCPAQREWAGREVRGLRGRLVAWDLPLQSWEGLGGISEAPAELGLMERQPSLGSGEGGEERRQGLGRQILK